MRAVLAVEACGSLVAAARQLGVVPSALTETLRQIEVETGVVLFDRKKRPVRPTAAGRQFLHEAAHIIGQFDGAVTSLSQKGRLHRGHIVVATIPSGGQAFLLPALSALRADHPGITATIYDGIGENTEQMVLSQKAELGLTASWGDRSELDYYKLASDEFVVVCHRDHPLALSKNQLNVSDLDRGDAIGLGPGNSIALMLAGNPDLPASLLRAEIHTYTTIAQLQLVRSGAGFAFLPRMAAAVLGTEDIVLLKVRGLDMRRDIFLIQRSDTTLSPAASLLRRFIIETASHASQG